MSRSNASQPDALDLIDESLVSVFGVESQQFADGSCFVIESDGEVTADRSAVSRTAVSRTAFFGLSGMPSLNDHAERATILARLDRLSPDAAPRWGTMTAPRMVAHISDSFRMAFGELSATAKRVPLARHFPLKHLILYVVPFPKNAPTAPEIISRTPDDFDVERSRVRQLAERMDRSVAGETYATHPIFGALTPREWGVLGYKHLDHHLRQFGV